MDFVRESEDGGVSEVIFSSQEVCEAFAITDRTLRRWYSQGAPKLGHDRWALFELMEWWTKKFDLDNFDIVWKRLEKMGVDFDDYLWSVEPE